MSTNKLMFGPVVLEKACGIRVMLSCSGYLWKMSSSDSETSQNNYFKHCWELDLAANLQNHGKNCHP